MKTVIKGRLNDTSGDAVGNEDIKLIDGSDPSMVFGGVPALATTTTDDEGWFYIELKTNDSSIDYCVVDEDDHQYYVQSDDRIQPIDVAHLVYG